MVKYLAGTTSSDDVSVLYGSLYDHDSVVKTSLDFCDELLGPSSQDQGTGLCCRTSFEEIESFAPYLSLIKPFAST